MTTTIRLRRPKTSNLSGRPTTLKYGEPFFDPQSNRIYVGDANGAFPSKAIQASYADEAGSCNGNSASATDVTTTINKKNISDIFESDGTTAKKATVALKDNENQDIKIKDIVNNLNFSNGTLRLRNARGNNVGDSVSNIMTRNASQTMTAKLIAQNNTDYATKQVRNIFLVPEGSDPPSSGRSGDICIFYTT